MEAKTVKSKKGAINKTKLKKNIKNILCRPDPIHWPQITEEEGKKLELALIKHRIEIPEFKKSHWNELKLIPKEQRPKPPKLKKVDGLLFGLQDCKDAIISGQCATIVIEASVNPRMIVQPVIELCTNKDIPFLCLEGLKRISTSNFGIPTSCLGVKCNSLLDLSNEVTDIAKSYPRSKNKVDVTEKMEICTENSKMETVHSNIKSTYPYLYRTNKKTRVFVPNQDKVPEGTTKFIGQDFIKFSGKQELKDSKGFMKMILKRVSNNANRATKK